MGWNVAAGLVAELLRDPYSHTNAAAAGWAFVPHPVDVFFRNWVDVQAQMNHGKGKVPPKPVERPWEKSARVGPRSSVPDPERAVRRAALKERLGLK